MQGAPELSMDRPPLAEYFWIAGVDSLSYGQDSYGNGNRNSNGALLPPPLASTIEEDRPLETDVRPPSRDSTSEVPASNPADPLQRLSSLSSEARRSIRSISGPEQLTTKSNRSSMTIKGVQVNSTNGTGFSDEDFEKALKKFASERDNFLDELSFTAGTILPNRPVMHPKTQKVKEEEASGNGNIGGLRPGLGSIRRKLSYRELSSAKRQPSVARNASVRTSKRLSNYNSVIPQPQPLHTSSSMHPLKRKFEPVLLDRYPPKSMVEENKRRGPFPDYVPMFAFPNDVNIVSSDERPRSTWHGFAMTTGDNSRLYGICVLIWIPLNPNAAAEVEARCEQWRRDNMTDEERELAASLGERLALERAKLSELLARLPMLSSGSPARESLEDEISAIEEKIQLMTDLLRPVRHGAASKIEGLTDGDTGLWIPRSYGVLGKDPTLTGFWKEWLKAVVVPMTNGAVLRVPPSSPKFGMWQPLERYVVNLCMEAFSPDTSKTQVEILIRELRLFARKEAENEIPGSRNTDLYALFRSMSIQNIVHLLEFMLSESRIILLSSHTAMLHLASKALVSLLYPLTWAGIFIPVLPARLLSALEAPCPYIVGIERRYEKIELPDDDFVLVDLDRDHIEATAQPLSLPRSIRRKLVSLLQLAAPHHNRYGVEPGPPAYAVETYPFDAFISENSSIFHTSFEHSTLAKYASLTSTSFGNATSDDPPKPPIFNAFLQARADQRNGFGGSDRPPTSRKSSSPPSPSLSPVNGHFPTPLPTTPKSQNSSTHHLTATLREKRSGHFNNDSSSRRSSSFATIEKAPILRRPSIPFSNHSSQPSLATIHTASDAQSLYGGYAPSTYAASTLAASTIMPSMLHQPVRNTGTTLWQEGHCLIYDREDITTFCNICDERADEGGLYKCSGCSVAAHGRCSQQVCLVCPTAFHPQQITAAFGRCFASMFFTYRKYMSPATGDAKKAGQRWKFDMDGFIKGVPGDQGSYLAMLRQTQAFNEFIHDRTTLPPSTPSILLFDALIAAKKTRSRFSLSAKTSSFSSTLANLSTKNSSGSTTPLNFLQDTSNHLYASACATPPLSRLPGDYMKMTTRIPAKLDPALMKEPRVVQGKARVVRGGPVGRKAVPSMLGPSLLGGKARQSQSTDI